MHRCSHRCSTSGVAKRASILYVKKRYAGTNIAFRYERGPAVRAGTVLRQPAV